MFGVFDNFSISRIVLLGRHTPIENSHRKYKRKQRCPIRRPKNNQVLSILLVSLFFSSAHAAGVQVFHAHFPVSGGGALHTGQWACTAVSWDHSDQSLSHCRGKWGTAGGVESRSTDQPQGRVHVWSLAVWGGSPPKPLPLYANTAKGNTRRRLHLDTVKYSRPPEATRGAAPWALPAAPALRA